ncbi:MAG: hypothetical protein ACFE9C_13695 [Candidatus Hodarchaeota archaeon]
MKSNTKKFLIIIALAYIVPIFMVLMTMGYQLSNITNITIVTLFTISFALIPIFTFFTDNWRTQVFSAFIFAFYTGTFLTNMSDDFGLSGTSTLSWLNINGFDLAITIGFIWPVLGSILLVIVIRVLIVLIYMRFFNRNFRKGYLKQIKSFSFKTFINRIMWVVLFTFAISQWILNYIDISYIMLEGDVYKFMAFGRLFGFEYPEMNLFLFMLPLSTAIFSAGWTIKDLGLMHYDIREKGLYEIEPVHRPYESIFKGYIGISLLFFLISVSGIEPLFTLDMYTSTAYAMYDPWVVLIASLLFVPFYFFQFFAIGVLIVPAYIIYFYLDKTKTQERLKEDYSVKRKERKDIKEDIFHPIVYGVAKEFGIKELTQEEKDKKSFIRYILVIIFVLACMGISPLIVGIADLIRLFA